jgi:hypothetical protein
MATVSGPAEEDDEDEEPPPAAPSGLEALGLDEEEAPPAAPSGLEALGLDEEEAPPAAPSGLDAVGLADAPRDGEAVGVVKGTGATSGQARPARHEVGPTRAADVASRTPHAG